MSYLYIKSPFAPHPHPLCSGKKRGVDGWWRNFIREKLCANIAPQFYHFPQDVGALKHN